MRKLLLIMIASLGLIFNASGKSVTVSFNTLGNCSICEWRIEHAVVNMPGVDSVHWDMTTDVTTVTYDSDTTDVYMIMHAIAKVGHDTEWFPAPDSAYKLLLGSCCEYERTNNYQNVQVGFLALTNQWYYPLGLAEKSGVPSLTVFPNPASDLVTIKQDGHEGTACKAILSSLRGEMLGSASFVETGSLHLGNLAPGEYILTLYAHGILVDRKKVIKH